MLKAVNLRKKYGQLEILKGISLEVNTGEIVSITGSSGAGKTTLLQILGTLDRPDDGTFTIDGINPFTLSQGELAKFRNRKIGFVFQFHHLLPEFTALENIVLPQLANGVARAEAETRAAHLLATVGVGARAEHRPAALSGGEQQRVAFCRALANQPRLLLADEPTGNLDPATSETVFAALMDLVRSTGLAALIATHNLELAARMDRRLRLDQGRLTEA